MKRNLIKLGKSRLFVITACFILATMVLATPVSASETAATINIGTLPPVTVSVVLDGVLYQPDEFNNIHQQLHANGVNLIFITAKNGVVYAFSNFDDFCKKYSFQFDLSNGTTQKDTPIIIDSIDPGYAYNWVGYNRGGNCSAIQEGWQGNLSSEWRNVISSVWYQPDYSSYLNLYVLCRDLNYGGDWFVWYEGTGNNDLRNLGFDNDAESAFFGHYQ